MTTGVADSLLRAARKCSRRRGKLAISLSLLLAVGRDLDDLRHGRGRLLNVELPILASASGISPVDRSVRSSVEPISAIGTLLRWV